MKKKQRVPEPKPSFHFIYLSTCCWKIMSKTWRLLRFLSYINKISNCVMCLPVYVCVMKIQFVSVCQFNNQLSHFRFCCSMATVSDTWPFEWQPLCDTKIIHSVYWIRIVFVHLLFVLKFVNHFNRCCYTLRMIYNFGWNWSSTNVR